MNLQHLLDKWRRHRDSYPVRTFNDVRSLLNQGCEMVYLHDEAGSEIAMIIPSGGYWASFLPVEAPTDHYRHDHVYPWGEPTYRTKSGKILTESDIRDLADEAERGYDIKPQEKGEQ